MGYPTMPTGITQLSRYLPANQAYLRNGVQQPQSCRDLSQKVSNLERQIKSLEEEYKRQKDRVWWDNFHSRNILGLTLIRDTSRSFIDLAGALVDTVVGAGLPESAAKKVGGVSTASTVLGGAMDAVQGAVDGNADAAYGAIIAAGTSVAGLNSTNFGIEIVRNMDAHGKASGTPTQQIEQTRATINVAFDSAGRVIDIAKSEVGNGRGGQTLGAVSGGLKVAKASANYNLNLELAFNQRLAERSGNEAYLRQIEREYNQGMNRVINELNAAKQQLARCAS